MEVGQFREHADGADDGERGGDDAELFKLRYKTRKRPLERLLGAMRVGALQLLGRLATRFAA
jgi:hypothetical protein